jgi:hypothetical protein
MRMRRGPQPLCLRQEQAVALRQLLGVAPFAPCRTTQGAPDSSGAAWQTDDGARLCHDEEGRVYKVQPGPRAASSSVLALL